MIPVIPRKSSSGHTSKNLDAADQLFYEIETPPRFLLEFIQNRHNRQIFKIDNFFQNRHVEQLLVNSSEHKKRS